MMKTAVFLFLSLILLSSCSDNIKNVNYPIAKKIAKVDTVHGTVLTDNYYWLRNIDDPEVKKHIKEENTYFDNYTKDIEQQQEVIYNEMLSKMDEEESTLPIKFQGYYYKASYPKDGDYLAHYRWKDGEEETLFFDENKYVKLFDAYEVASQGMSPNNNLLAFSVDQSGSGELDIHFLNMENNTLMDDVLEKISDIYWANDSKTLFYIKDDAVTNRSNKLYKHILGQNQSQDILIYEEKNEEFSLNISRSKSLKYLFVYSESKDENKTFSLDLDYSNSKLKEITKLKPSVQNQIYHYKDWFYVLTNENAPNFQLKRIKINALSKFEYETVIPHNNSVIIENVDIFNNYIVLLENHKGLKKFRVINTKNNTNYYIPVDEVAYDLGSENNLEFEANTYRYYVESPVQPNTIYEWNLDTKERKILKSSTVKGYNKDDYKVERILVPSHDNVKVPMTIIYKKDTFKKDGTNPLLIEGYGSYGITFIDSFSSRILSLLDQNYVYAVPHVRGGGYLGNEWYKEGKYLNKKNTFKDFIACTEYLVNQKYVDKKRVVARGGSAGGLLMGVISNMKPDLYNVIIAEVPFVDVINTMLDETIPLTTSEYKEWGNPNEKKYFDYMLSYSPYDNITEQEYPNMVFVTGLEDENVPYWEAAKMVAKLRDKRIENGNKILLNISMEDGHQGASGRYPSIEEEAKIMALILKMNK